MNENTQERKIDNEQLKNMSDIPEEDHEEDETEKDREDARYRGQSVQSLINVFIMDACGVRCSMPSFYKAIIAMNSRMLCLVQCCEHHFELCLLQVSYYHAHFNEIGQQVF